MPTIGTSSSPGTSPGQIASVSRGHGDDGAGLKVPYQAAVLALSAERDRWLRARLAFARYAYERGHHDGWDAGRRALLEELAEDERYMLVRLRPVFARPDHAELEARRWGPGGREHFGDPRPGDYPGGPVAAW